MQAMMVLKQLSKERGQGEVLWTRTWVVLNQLSKEREQEEVM